jgi:rod shape-determining protein MreC
METATSTIARPLTDIPGWFRSQADLRRQLSALQKQNGELGQESGRVAYLRSRLAEYDGLTGTARRLGYALVPARVVGYGGAQSLTDTVTIDAGTAAGITPDMTVVNAQGLVGRVIKVTTSSATVLLIVDADSTVGGRLASDLDAGFVTGSGSLAAGAPLRMQLLDQTDTPDRGDTVVTWGSGKAPYVAGVTIGTVTRVYSDLQDSTKTVEVRPAVDFGALDTVGVVVPSGTRSDRTVIDADGSLR